MRGLLVAFGMLALANLSPARAEGVPGVAYDVVTRVLLNDETSSFAPGNFDADFEAAGRAAVVAREAEKADKFDPMALFRAGIAQRRYIAGSKERTDDLASGTATIFDCNARTMTRLIPRNKTYWVRALNGTSPKTATPDGGSKPAAYVPRKSPYEANTRALGPRQIGLDATDGYRADVRWTIPASAGPALTQRMSLTEYLTNRAGGNAQCSMLGDDPVPIGIADMSASTYALLTMSTSPVWAYVSAQYGLVSPVLSGGKRADNISFALSGPAIPSGRMAAVTIFTIDFGQKEGSYTIMLERAHHRPIASDDPIFYIPADYEKTN